MSITEFNSYTDRLRTTDRDTYLGILCWYTVTEATRIDHTELHVMLNRCGLGDFVPPAPRDENVFKQACTHAARKRIPLTSDTYANLMVRDVKTIAGRVYKNLVVETVDGDNRRLKYEPVIEVAFNPDNGIIETTDLIFHTDIPDVAKHAVEQIRNEYNAWKGCVNAYTIREMFRRIVGAAGATAVRPTGGVYFVMRDRLTLVDALDLFASDENLGVTFHITPLLDDGKQRDMLRKAYEAETTGECEKRLVEIDALISAGGVTPKKFVALVKEMNDLKARTAEYSDLLSDQLTEAGLATRALEVNMKRLARHKK